MEDFPLLEDKMGYIDLNANLWRIYLVKSEVPYESVRENILSISSQIDGNIYLKLTYCGLTNLKSKISEFYQQLAGDGKNLNKDCNKNVFRKGINDIDLMLFVVMAPDWQKTSLFTSLLSLVSSHKMQMRGQNRVEEKDKFWSKFKSQLEVIHKSCEKSGIYLNEKLSL